MTKATVLLVEGKRADRPVFAPQLQKKGFTVHSYQSGSDAAGHLVGVKPDIIVVNGASLASTGVRICQSLQAVQEKRTPMVLVIDADKMVDASVADVVLYLPFTIQKLVNRLRPYLPGDGANIIQAGPLRLDVDHRRVRCMGKNARLTPRLSILLQILLQHRGEVVEREDLFKRVWETDYTGDTRTLDVHVSWLRRAIEVDPDNPKFLHTIRGVGYRLDV